MSAVWEALGTGSAEGDDLGVRITYRADYVGDTTLDIEVWDHTEGEDDEASISFDRDEALGLYHALGDWLMATNPADAKLSTP